MLRPGNIAHKRLMQAILSLAACILLFQSCNGTGSSGTYVRNLRSEVKRQFVQRNVDSALICARRLLAAADSADLHQETVTAVTYIGQAQMIKGNTDSMNRYFDLAQSMYREGEDDNAMGIMCNALAIHALYSELNTTKSIEYLLQGMRHAAICRDDTLMTMLRCNMAIAHYVNRDTTGLQYAIDTWRHGTRDNNRYMIYFGALTSSYLLYLKGEYDSALVYLNHVLPRASEYKDRHGIYTLAGDIFLKKHDTARALEYYDLALRYNDVTDRFSGIDIYISISAYLKSVGRYGEALDMVDKGLDISFSNNNTLHRYLLYRQGADICSLMNNPDGYAEYSGLYKKERDSIFNLSNEREIYRLKISYEKDSWNRTLDSYRQTVTERARTWIIIGCTLLVLTLAAAWILIRKHLIHERELMRMLEELRPKFENLTSGASSGPEPPAQTDPQPAGNSDRMDDLFQSLESLMRDSRIYRERNISRDKVAEMLNTNRTYVTNIIKEHTSLSFFAYINAFRIEEAIQILSDKNNSTPIKAISEDLGFKSLSTFYKLFSAATGQSPASFRNSFFRQ